MSFSPASYARRTTDLRQASREQQANAAWLRLFSIFGGGAIERWIQPNPLATNRRYLFVSSAMLSHAQ